MKKKNLSINKSDKKNDFKHNNIIKSNKNIVNVKINKKNIISKEFLNKINIIDQKEQLISQLKSNFNNINKFLNKHDNNKLTNNILKKYQLNKHYNEILKTFKFEKSKYSFKGMKSFSINDLQNFAKESNVNMNKIIKRFSQYISVSYLEKEKITKLDIDKKTSNILTLNIYDKVNDFLTKTKASKTIPLQKLKKKSLFSQVSNLFYRPKKHKDKVIINKIFSNKIFIKQSNSWKFFIICFSLLITYDYIDLSMYNQIIKNDKFNNTLITKIVNFFSNKNSSLEDLFSKDPRRILNNFMIYFLANNQYLNFVLNIAEWIINIIDTLTTKNSAVFDHIKNIIMFAINHNSIQNNSMDNTDKNNVIKNIQNMLKNFVFNIIKLLKTIPSLDEENQKKIKNNIITSIQKFSIIPKDKLKNIIDNFIFDKKNFQYKGITIFNLNKLNETDYEILRETYQIIGNFFYILEEYIEKKMPFLIILKKLILRENFNQENKTIFPYLIRSLNLMQNQTWEKFSTFIKDPTKEALDELIKNFSKTKTDNINFFISNLKTFQLFYQQNIHKYGFISILVTGILRLLNNNYQKKIRTISPDKNNIFRNPQVKLFYDIAPFVFNKKHIKSITEKFKFINDRKEQYINKSNDGKNKLIILKRSVLRNFNEVTQDFIIKMLKNPNKLLKLHKILLDNNKTKIFWHKQSQNCNNDEHYIKYLKRFSSVFNNQSKIQFLINNILNKTIPSIINNSIMFITNLLNKFFSKFKNLNIVSNNKQQSIVESKIFYKMPDINYLSTPLLIKTNQKSINWAEINYKKLNKVGLLALKDILKLNLDILKKIFPKNSLPINKIYLLINNYNKNENFDNLKKILENNIPIFIFFSNNIKIFNGYKCKFEFNNSNKNNDYNINLRSLILMNFFNNNTINLLSNNKDELKNILIHIIKKHQEFKDIFASNLDFLNHKTMDLKQFNSIIKNFIFSQYNLFNLNNISKEILTTKIKTKKNKKSKKNKKNNYFSKLQKNINLNNNTNFPLSPIKEQTITYNKIKFIDFAKKEICFEEKPFLIQKNKGILYDNISRNILFKALQQFISYFGKTQLNLIMILLNETNKRNKQHEKKKNQLEKITLANNTFFVNLLAQQILQNSNNLKGILFNEFIIEEDNKFDNNIDFLNILTTIFKEVSTFISEDHKKIQLSKELKNYLNKFDTTNIQTAYSNKKNNYIAEVLFKNSSSINTKLKLLKLIKKLKENSDKEFFAKNLIYTSRFNSFINLIKTFLLRENLKTNELKTNILPFYDYIKTYYDMLLKNSKPEELVLIQNLFFSLKNILSFKSDNKQTNNNVHFFANQGLFNNKKFKQLFINTLDSRNNLSNKQKAYEVLTALDPKLQILILSNKVIDTLKHNFEYNEKFIDEIKQNDFTKFDLKNYFQENKETIDEAEIDIYKQNYLQDKEQFINKSLFGLQKVGRYQNDQIELSLPDNQHTDYKQIFFNINDDFNGIENLNGFVSLFQRLSYSIINDNNYTIWQKLLNDLGMKDIIINTQTLNHKNLDNITKQIIPSLKNLQFKFLNSLKKKKINYIKKSIFDKISKLQKNDNIIYEDIKNINTNFNYLNEQFNNIILNSLFNQASIVFNFLKLDEVNLILTELGLKKIDNLNLRTIISYFLKIFDFEKFSSFANISQKLFDNKSILKKFLSNKYEKLSHFQTTHNVIDRINDDYISTLNINGPIVNNSSKFKDITKKFQSSTSWFLSLDTLSLNNLKFKFQIIQNIFFLYMKNKKMQKFISKYNIWLIIDKLKENSLLTSGDLLYIIIIIFSSSVVLFNILQNVIFNNTQLQNFSLMQIFKSIFKLINNFQHSNKLNINSQNLYILKNLSFILYIFFNDKKSIRRFIKILYLDNNNNEQNIINSLFEIKKINVILESISQQYKNIQNLNNNKFLNLETKTDFKYNIVLKDIIEKYIAFLFNIRKKNTNIKSINITIDNYENVIKNYQNYMLELLKNPTFSKHINKICNNSIIFSQFIIPNMTDIFTLKKLLTKEEIKKIKNKSNFFQNRKINEDSDPDERIYFLLKFILDKGMNNLISGIFNNNAKEESQFVLLIKKTINVINKASTENKYNSIINNIVSAILFSKYFSNKLKSIQSENNNFNITTNNHDNIK